MPSPKQKLRNFPRVNLQHVEQEMLAAADAYTHLHSAMVFWDVKHRRSPFILFVRCPCVSSTVCLQYAAGSIGLLVATMWPPLKEATTPDSRQLENGELQCAFSHQLTDRFSLRCNAILLQSFICACASVSWLITTSRSLYLSFDSDKLQAAAFYALPNAPAFACPIIQTCPYCLVAQNALLEPPSFCCVSAENVVLSCWWGCWCCCRNAGVAEKAPGLKGCARGLAKSGHACSGGSWTCQACKGLSPDQLLVVRNNSLKWGPGQCGKDRT
eukprot:1141623-Pelagomonas_calceolata.AAC.1